MSFTNVNHKSDIKKSRQKKHSIAEVNYFTEYCELIFENIVSGGVFNTTPFPAY